MLPLQWEKNPAPLPTESQYNRCLSDCQNWELLQLKGPEETGLYIAAILAGN